LQPFSKHEKQFLEKLKNFKKKLGGLKTSSIFATLFLRGTTYRRKDKFFENIEVKFKQQISTVS
jgi:hypothetical protein